MRIWSNSGPEICPYTISFSIEKLQTRITKKIALAIISTQLEIEPICT